MENKIRAAIIKSLDDLGVECIDHLFAKAFEVGLIPEDEWVYDHNQYRQALDSMYVRFGVRFQEIARSIDLFLNETARKVHANELDPLDACDLIASVRYRNPERSMPKLDPAVYIASEYRVRPKDRKFFEREAQEYLRSLSM